MLGERCCEKSLNETCAAPITGRSLIVQMRQKWVLPRSPVGDDLLRLANHRLTFQANRIASAARQGSYRESCAGPVARAERAIQRSLRNSWSSAAPVERIIRWRLPEEAAARIANELEPSPVVRRSPRSYHLKLCLS